MGGVVFIVATVIAYVAGHFVLATLPSEQLGAPTGPTITGVVLLGLFVGLRRGRLHRRLPQGAQAQQPRPEQAQEAARADASSAPCFGVVALWFPSAGPSGETVADRTISFVRDISWLDITKIGALVLFVFVVHGDVQRGQPHRRPGRPGHRRVGHGARRVRADRVLAVPALGRATPTTPGTLQLRGARSAGDRDDRRRPRPRPASASCGGTRRRPGSSWATPVRWRSAA